ncbi:MAG: hypothetical protein HYY28_05315 [Betaproteobacteria bacterium]|nr:hypothetical protein [Betaproteobacteria bacterium]
MRSRIVKSFSPLKALVLCAAVAFASGAFAADLSPQSSQADGVAIRVKPTDVSPGASSWQFQVTLDTHSGSLDDDLAKTAVLVDRAGKRYVAVSWQGDPAGGHHRSGVLRFKALSPRPDAIEMRIQRSGEAAPRSFRWQLK